MKKRLVSIIVVLVALTVVLSVYAAESGTERPRPGGFRGMSPEERNAMRDRFQNMSEEERAKFREEMRERFQNMSEEDRAAMRQRMGSRSRLSRDEQLAAITAMQQQLAKLKTSIENSGTPTDGNFRDMSEEERNKLREQMTKARTDRESAITALRAEIDKLSPPRPTETQMATVRELRAISEIADKEKAKETKTRIDALIAKQSQQMPMTGMTRVRDGAGRRTGGEGSEADTPRRPAREGASRNSEASSRDR